MKRCASLLILLIILVGCVKQGTDVTPTVQQDNTDDIRTSEGEQRTVGDDATQSNQSNDNEAASENTAIDSAATDNNSDISNNGIADTQESVVQASWWDAVSNIAPFVVIVLLGLIGYFIINTRLKAVERTLVPARTRGGGLFRKKQPDSQQEAYPTAYQALHNLDTQLKHFIEDVQSFIDGTATAIQHIDKEDQNILAKQDQLEATLTLINGTVKGMPTSIKSIDDNQKQLSADLLSMRDVLLEMAGQVNPAIPQAAEHSRNILDRQTHLETSLEQATTSLRAMENQITYLQQLLNDFSDQIRPPLPQMIQQSEEILRHQDGLTGMLTGLTDQLGSMQQEIVDIKRGIRGLERPSSPTVDVPSKVNQRLERALVAGFTHPGPRELNQDSIAYVTPEELKGLAQILIVADGIGSSQHAEIAAETVVTVFRRELSKLINSGNWSEEDIAKVYDLAVNQLNSHELHRYGSYSSNLATTLIAVIETYDQFYYTYLGNGGIYLFRDSDEIDGRMLHYSLLSGQEIGQQTASLSPNGLSHKPVVGSIGKSRGDFIIVGTDGAFSQRMFKDFYDLKKYRISTYLYEQLSPISPYKTKMENQLRHLVEELASLSNSRGGPMVDDNITIGLIGTCR